MKILKYNFCTKVNHGTEENPEWKENLIPVKMPWNEANETTAKREAYNGEYTIEDDGIEPIPTESDDINAMLIDQEYRLTLLELGVTE